MNINNILVVGLGYVGLSNAILMSRKYPVIAIDNNKKKIDLLKDNISPIKEEKILLYLKNKKLNIKFDLSKDIYFRESSLIFIALPTSYCDVDNKFDTVLLEKIITKAIGLSKDSLIIIKSTIPIGFTDYINNKLNTNRILFSPEFLREGHSLDDSLKPQRVILSNNNKLSSKILKLLSRLVTKKDCKFLLMGTSEAESVKLFSNCYLALRISFFNELDSFAMASNLNTKKIIEAVCLDQRIGLGYNNPSFGFGGYCLPKDTKQLVSNFKEIPQSLFSGVIKSNELRKKYISKYIMKNKPKCIGIYRLIMKSKSDNFRESSILDIIKELKKYKIKIFIYEPLITNKYFNNCLIVNNFDKFNEFCDLIISNRISSDLNKVKKKIFTRDCFATDL